MFWCDTVQVTAREHSSYQHVSNSQCLQRYSLTFVSPCIIILVVCFLWWCALTERWAASQANKSR